MTFNKTVNQTETTQDNTNQALTLLSYICTENKAPIYIIERGSEYRPLLNGQSDFLFLENVFEDLRNEKLFFKNNIKDAKTPVIIRSTPGNKKAENLAAAVYNRLKACGVSVFRQDANTVFDAITATNINEVKAELVKQYQNNYSAGGTISEFDNVILSNANTPAIKTGFNIFDKVLDGGLYEGLYAIGAISSLGKTTFCLNIAEQIAAGGNDVFIIALEMSKYQLISRSISRLTFCRYLNDKEHINYEWCKTSRGISDGSRYKNYNSNELELIKTARNYYAENIGQHIYIHEAIGNLTVTTIRELIARHYEYTGRRPVVIVDYLQLLKHENQFVNSNDKTRTDYNLTELKQLSRDYKLPIIVISSFNRAGYNTEVKFECFKESGGIDFGCDVIMGLQLAGVGTNDFNVNEAKAKNPREIELVFLKNREAAVGDIIKYLYYPMFNHFEETAEDPRAEREYKAEQARAAKQAEKQDKAEAAKLEHYDIVKLSFDACEKNGVALITEMVNFCGGKPGVKTMEKYIKETGKYKILGNKVNKI